MPHYPRWINGELWIPMELDGNVRTDLETLAFAESIMSPGAAATVITYFNFTRYVRSVAPDTYRHLNLNV